MRLAIFADRFRDTAKAQLNTEEQIPVEKTEQDVDYDDIPWID